METLSWPVLREILSWCSHPRDVASLAHTCRGLHRCLAQDVTHYYELAVYYMSLGHIYYNDPDRPLWQAIRRGSSMYIDIALQRRIGFHGWADLMEAVYIAGSCGRGWVIDRISTRFPELNWSSDICMWRAAMHGQVEIVFKMIKMGATCLTAAISYAEFHNPGTPETWAIREGLLRILEKARAGPNNELYC